MSHHFVLKGNALLARLFTLYSSSSGVFPALHIARHRYSHISCCRVDRV